MVDHSHKVPYYRFNFPPACLYFNSNHCLEHINAVSLPNINTHLHVPAISNTYADSFNHSTTFRNYATCPIRRFLSHSCGIFFALTSFSA